MDFSTAIRLSALSAPETDVADVSRDPLSPEELSDECLMLRTAEKNEEALALLFRRYARLVRGVALRILRDDSEADDLLQELFLFLYRKAHIFDPRKATVRSRLSKLMPSKTK
jgi:Sigma-70 region 2